MGLAAAAAAKADSKAPRTGLDVVASARPRGNNLGAGPGGTAASFSSSAAGPDEARGGCGKAASATGGDRSRAIGASAGPGTAAAAALAPGAPRCRALVTDGGGWGEDSRRPRRPTGVPGGEAPKAPASPEAAGLLGETTAAPRPELLAAAPRNCGGSTAWGRAWCCVACGEAAGQLCQVGTVPVGLPEGAEGRGLLRGKAEELGEAAGELLAGNFGSKQRLSGAKAAGAAPKLRRGAGLAPAPTPGAGTGTAAARHDAAGIAKTALLLLLLGVPGCSSIAALAVLTGVLQARTAPGL